MSTKGNSNSRREEEGNKCSDRYSNVGGVEDEVAVKANIDLGGLMHQLPAVVHKVKSLTFMVVLVLGGADGVGGGAVLAGAGGGPP